MTRSHGRCHRNERLRMGYTHGHCKMTTLNAGLRMTGIMASVGQVLVPDLRHGGGGGVMENSASHKRTSVQALIKAAGARLMFLPPYNPDFNPIEKAFARLKAMLRKAEERTISGL